MKPGNLQIIRTLHPPEIYLEQLALLHTEAGSPTTAADIQRRLEILTRDNRLLLAVDGETLLGYAHLRISRDLNVDETVEVVSIVVRKTHRRQGLGRRLINAAEIWSRESGRARLLMRSDITRADAHAFFVALGYDQSSTSIEFVQDLSGDTSSRSRP